jgi:CRISPR-associated protein Cas1
MKIKRYSLPRTEDRAPTLYLEHCLIERQDSALAAIDEDGEISIPAAKIGALFLGPGTTVTHSAIASLSESGVPVVWTGEEGVRCYANSQPLVGDPSLAYRQARVFSSDIMRADAARRLLAFRFPGMPIARRTSLDEMRGMEGTAMAGAYSRAAIDAGIAWQGRDTDSPWEQQNAANQALSHCFSALYGLAASVVSILGLSPCLGVLHSGHMHSFVFDLADAVKVSHGIPTAFAIAARDHGDALARACRLAMRDLMRASRLTARMVEVANAAFPEDGV